MLAIDIHTHAFHPRIAARAVASLERTYGLRCQASGLLADLERQEQAAGIDRYALLCAATSASQVVPANNYAIEVHGSDAGCGVAFGTLHPGFAKWEAELGRLERAGIRGLKLHPDFQGFHMADPAFEPIFEACSGRFVILFHIGSFTEHASLALSSPMELKRIVHRFPRLDVIAAHMGGYRMWNLAMDVLRGIPPAHLWLDTSSTTPFVSRSDLGRLFGLLPEDHYCFGTDWPIYRPEEEMRRLKKKTDWSDDRLERLMGNAASLLADYGMLDGTRGA